MGEGQGGEGLRRAVAVFRHVFESGSSIRPLVERHLGRAREAACVGLAECDKCDRAPFVAARTCIDVALVGTREATRRLRSMIRSDLRLVEARLDGGSDSRGALRTMPRLVLEPYDDALRALAALPAAFLDSPVVSLSTREGVETVRVLLQRARAVVEGELAAGLAGARAAMAEGTPVSGRHAPRPESSLDAIDARIPV
jgi:hypothetical protein